MQERDTVVFYGLSVIGHSSVCSEKDLQKNANRDRTTERRGGGGGGAEGAVRVEEEGPPLAGH